MKVCKKSVLQALAHPHREVSYWFWYATKFYVFHFNVAVYSPANILLNKYSFSKMK